jgi:hypothetical protein
MKNLIGLLLVVFMITACATTTKSRTANVTIDNHQYSIYAQNKDGLTSMEVTLFVNGQEIGKGTIDQNHWATNISGTSSDGIKFDAECGASMTGIMSLKCLVYAKGKKVAELPLQ